MNECYMIDIETTGTDKEKDWILEIGVVKMHFDGYWIPQDHYHSLLHYSGEPQTVFAKKYMSELYEKCNNEHINRNIPTIRGELRNWLHNGEVDNPRPKFFMGWNASTFDIPFMFEKQVLEPSYHKQVAKNKEELFGDVHYRVYEQSGLLLGAIDTTGFDRKTVKALATDLAPKLFEMPEGKAHDAIYDCYNQINMQNGLIKLLRKGYNKYD